MFNMKSIAALAAGILLSLCLGCGSQSTGRDAGSEADAGCPETDAGCPGADTGPEVCVPDVVPIPKEVFEGEWYYKVTVTETDWRNQLTFIGEDIATYYGGASDIRWEITHDYLNGYMVALKKVDPDGNLVDNVTGSESLALSFRIVKHFDLRATENATTCGDFNVVVEDNRPWDEREYFTVDWSTNLATGLLAPLSWDLTAGDVVREPVPVFQNAEWFNIQDQEVDLKEYESGEDPALYLLNIDLQEQIRFNVQPWWRILYNQATDPELVRYRISLMKKNPEGLPTRKYLAQLYPDDFFQRFGYYRMQHEVYDPDHSPPESQYQYRINRWDVGCYIDELTGEQVCEKIAFYMSPTMPTAEEDPDLYQWTMDVVSAWNEALQTATGRTDPIIELRENEPLLDADGQPVTDSAGRVRYKYEVGDLRYSFINYVTIPNPYAPLAYGPITADPNTGEIVNGMVVVNGYWVDYLVTQALGLYDVATGNCSLEDITEGLYWNEDSQACDGAIPGSSADNSDQPADLNFLTPALQTAYWPKGRINRATPPFNNQYAEAMRPIAEECYLDRLLEGNPLDLGKMSIAAGTGYQTLMIPGATFASTFPGAEHTEQVRDDFAVSNRLSESRLRQMRDFFVKKGKYCQLEPDYYENNILAFVEDMVGLSREEFKQTIRRWVYYTAAMHQMGHVLGLRHNFMGSVDKNNFPDAYQVEYAAYWDEVEALRGQYGSDITSGDPAAYRSYTQAVHQIPRAYERFATSSIMDYNGDWEGVVDGLPSYDRAAILFGYGGKVEVRENGEWVLREYEDGDFVKDDVYDPDTPSASGRIVRYYMSCSDESVFDDFFCMPHDRGVTATEIIRNLIQDRYKSYFYRNFKRDSTIVDGRRPGYYSRKWIYTYYMYAKAFAQLTGNTIRSGEFRDSLWSGLEAINNGPGARDMLPGYRRAGGEDLLRAHLLFYYYLLYDVIQRPNAGLYELRYDAFGERFWQSSVPADLSPDAVSATIDHGPGWGWSDRWGNQTDPDVSYDKLIHVGTELDKITAYEILSIPAALNHDLRHENADGNSYWGDIWNNDGRQLWKITRSLIAEAFSHDQSTWCMDTVGNLTAYPIDLLEGAASGELIAKDVFEGQIRCAAGSYPVQPGMDALFAVHPIFHAVAGGKQAGYPNRLFAYMDSQIKDGDSRFSIPYAEGTPEYEAYVAEFMNSTGTKIYQAVNTRDGLSVSYLLVDMGRRIANRIRMAQACYSGIEHPEQEGSLGTHGRTCPEILACYSGSDPDYCEQEGWSSLFVYDSLAWHDLDRVEAMLIMMQDMIDLARSAGL